jgi:hypothetical protein
MNIETAIELYKKLEQEKDAQNFFARANSRYILFGVNEPRENFPPTLESNLDFGSNSLAFSYLSIGCCMFENNYKEFDDRNGKEKRRFALEKGAEFIEYTHFYEQNRKELSLYYLLIGALAYYASNQYSKAFILMKKVNDLYQTDVSRLTSAFLRKEFDINLNILSRILTNENDYLTNNLEESGQTIDDRIQVVLYARAFAHLINFLFFGNQESLAKTKEILSDLLELLALEREPSMWWVVRLLIIIVNGFEESALWTAIPPYIPDNDNQLTSKFIKNLIFNKNSVIELFVVQRKALSKVISEKGAVVSLPTSSGKTRIAELAILKCLSDNPDAKIMYLAPFRSLCYEVESNLNNTFEKIGFIVSQLYGSSQVSQIDKFIIEESHIFVATPEKAKVILRANDSVRNQIKLIIIDEGHLLNENKRQVRNEMFIEELKKYIQNNNGKVILLSAVLPNTSEIAEWITQDSNAYINEKERVARQRLGLLEFNKKSKNVNLEWFNGEKPYKRRILYDNNSNNSFNNNFLQNITSKKEAVANTAYKLSVSENFSTPILVFVAKAKMVISHAEQILKCLKDNNIDKYDWINSKEEWNMFRLIVNEYNEKEIKRIWECAEYGILAHKRNMPEELKILIEKLIRIGKPRFIVGNKTLGQGVNLNISTIIIGEASYNFDENNNVQLFIDKGEFWNVAGRAGRAFVDTEGRVLYATQKQNEIEKGLEYFNNEPKNVRSGFLQYIPFIKEIADKCNLSFQNLLELIAENNHYEIIRIQENNYGNDIQEFFNWIDDALLSISIQFEDSLENVDNYLRQTLAYIQAKNNDKVTQEDVINFLKARLKAVEIQTKSKDKKRIVSSGLPLASALKLGEIWKDIENITVNYLESNQTIDDKIQLIEKIEDIMKLMPSNDFRDINFNENDINNVRILWLKGENIGHIKDSSKIVSNYFAYIVSWFLGAIANHFRKDKLNKEANIYEELAVCCELGLPNLLSAKIYLLGIKSRVASIEINQNTMLHPSKSIIELREFFRKDIENIKIRLTNPLSKEWINIIEKTLKSDSHVNNNITKETDVQLKINKLLSIIK